jgi:hypothetical protein
MSFLPRKEQHQRGSDAHDRRQIPERDPRPGIPSPQTHHPHKERAEARVIALVGVLDRAVVAAVQGERDHGVEAQVLARAVVAAGRPLMERAPAPAIAATLAAAGAYARSPGDETQSEYFACATSSYPYGSGEGHYGIEDGCEPGSGCISGAGTLLCVGRQVGFEVVVDALTAELVPWLRGHAAQNGQM